MRAAGRGIATHGMRAFVLACGLCAGAPALANMGKPWRDGDLAGEPVGFERTRVAEEHLWIDMTQLQGEEQGIGVQVRYELEHRGPASVLKPLFAVGPVHIRDFQAHVGDRAVPTRVLKLQRKALPAAWLGSGARQLPGSPAYDTAQDQADTVDVVEVTLPVSEGANSVRIAYRATPMVRLHGDGPTYAYQFEYLLAPARSWAGFGKLVAEIEVPQGWRLETLPAARKQDEGETGTAYARTDVYRLESDGLPADAIALKAQAPPGLPYRVLLAGTWLAFFAVLWRGGRWSGALAANAVVRRRRSGLPARAWLHAAMAGIGWSLVAAYAGFVALHAPPMALPEGQVAPVRMDLRPAAVALAAIAVLPLGVLRSRLRIRRAMQASPGAADA